MTELSFDVRGNLKPYEIIEISSQSFQLNFINSFERNSSRRVLYEKYQQYTENLSKLLSEPYYQWIDGSFISTKTNPKGIDLVTIISYKDYENHSSKIDSEFIGSKARNIYQVDAYIVPDYPPDHHKHRFTESDKLYWRTLFSKTRLNRAK